MPHPDRTPRPRLRCAAAAVALAGVITGSVMVVLRLVPALQDRLYPTLAASFVPYGILAWSLAMLLAVLLTLTGLGRSASRLHPVVPTTAALAVVGLVVQLSWLAPLVVADRPPAEGPRLTVVTVNLRGGGADLEALGRELADADVAMLIEIGPQTAAALAEDPAGQRLRYQVGDPGLGVIGTMIWSRHPLRDERQIPGRLGQWGATADVPGIGPVRLTAVHPCNPPCGMAVWQAESAAVRQAAGDPDGAAVIAGDFNATDDHVTMRRLYDDGWASAVDLSGAGWIPTYPANGYTRPAGIPVPPLIAIDHVLLGRRLTAVSVRPVDVERTDHRGLRAVIAPAA